jgi:hypothetical protein
MNEENRWRANWNKIMRPMVLNMIADRIRGPSYWLGLFRFLVIMGVLIPAMFLAVMKFRILFAKVRGSDMGSIWKSVTSGNNGLDLNQIKFLND